MQICSAHEDRVRTETVVRGDGTSQSASIACQSSATCMPHPQSMQLNSDLPKADTAPPQFLGPCLLWPNVGCIKMPLGMEVGLSPGDFVLDGDPARLPKKGRSPQFSAHVYCGQMAACLKMPLATEVGRDIVLDGDPAPPPLKGHSRPMSVVAKRLDGLRCHLVWR